MINVCHILIFRAKAYVIRTLLLCDWSIQQTASKQQTQYRKECCSVVSSRFLGGALRDIPKNGCEGDYVLTQLRSVSTSCIESKQRYLTETISFIGKRVPSETDKIYTFSRCQEQSPGFLFLFLYNLMHFLGRVSAASVKFWSP